MANSSAGRNCGSFKTALRIAKPLGHIEMRAVGTLSILFILTFMRCSSQSLEGTWLAPLTASSYPVEMGFDTLFEIQEFNLDRFVESKIEPATGILLAFTPTGKFVICFGYEREVWDNPVRPGESGMTSIESDCEPDDLQMKWNLVHRDMLRLNCYKYGTDTLFKELVYKVNHTSDSTLNLSRIK